MWLATYRSFPRNNRVKRKGLPLLLVLWLGLFLPVTTVANYSRVQAAETKKNIGLRIAPLRSYPVQKPGETTAGSIKLSNLTGSSQNVSLSSEQFKTIGENYDYKFEPNSNVDWVRVVDKDILLAGGENRSIAYSLAVPAGASPGGYYLAIVATTKDEESSTDITVIKRVASIIYLEVSGDITRKTNLLAFELPWLSTKRSIDIDVRIANEGNSHDRSRVAVTYRRWPFGKESSPTLIERLTLPSTVRKINGTVELPGLPGIYKINVTFAPPQGGTTNKVRYVLVLPFWCVILLVMLAISAILLWRKLPKNKKRYKST